MIHAVVDSGETIELNVDEGDYDQVKVKVQVIRELDMILPRTRCVVRHRAENVKKEELSRVVLDFVFDVGRLVEPDRRREHAEALLRQDIRRNPRDALAAANLGFRSRRTSWWKRWLRHAQHGILCLIGAGVT